MLQIVLLALLQQGPAFAREIVALFQKGADPTPAEWEQLFSRYKTPYSAYVSEDVLKKAIDLVAAGRGGERVSPGYGSTAYGSG